MSFAFHLPENDLDSLFPFHFWMDRNLHFLRWGPGMKKLFSGEEAEHFSDLFTFMRPAFGIEANYESILEYTDQVIILESVSESNHPLIRGQIRATEDKLLFVGSPWVTEVSDLEEHGLLVTDFAIHDPVVDLLQVLKVHQLANEDVQNQRDELMRKNQEISDLARFPSENPNPILRLSIQGTLVYANKAAEPLTTAWKMNLGDPCPPEVVKHLEKVLPKASRLEFELPVGEAHYKFMLVSYSKTSYVNLYARDITARKQFEATIRESEERYKQLVEDANDLIYRTDRQGNFTYANPVAERILGMTAAAMIGKHYTELIRPDWRARTGQFYQEQLDNNNPTSYFEFPAIDGKGQPMWIGQNVKVLKEGEKIIGFQAVARDISAIKSMETSLKEAKSRAEESLSFKEQFLANMSHEIRTPMNGILGMSKLLQSAALNQKESGYLDAIQTSANNLLVIINDILDLSKVEAGQLELERIGFDVHQLINSTVTNVEYLAAQKDLLISREVAPQLHGKILLGDPTRLNQIITNLLSNAIKFTTDGEVKVACELLETTDKKSKLRLSVSDTGIGIPADKLNTIFESFKQVDASTTRKYGGTGLGLSITKTLVELHESQLEVESEEGKGTTFWCDLQFDIGSAADVPESANNQEEVPSLEAVRVLLVEDNRVNQVFATSILEDAQAQVEVAENGQEAIDKLKESSYDIVLMDNQMPVMGGLEATQIIRNELKLEVPIIALTANALKGAHKDFLKQGMNAYISKPFQDTVLLRTINELLDQPTTSISEEPTPQPAETPTTSKPSYSLDKLHQMSRGNQGFVDKMVKMFCQETPTTIGQLKKHLADQYIEGIYAAAHKLGPSLKMMDMMATAALADELEVTAQQNGDWDRIAVLSQTVIQHCEAVVAELA